MDTEPTDDRVLVAGLPTRYLEGAIEVCRVTGWVVLPAGSPGDLDLARPGTAVLLMISGQGAVPAATWRATFVRRIAPADDGFPDGLPPTWLEDRQTAREPSPATDDDDEEDDAGPQSYFEVERLEPLPKQDWVFANELVRKHERGGRAYFPRAPRLIQPPA